MSAEPIQSEEKPLTHQPFSILDSLVIPSKEERDPKMAKPQEPAQEGAPAPTPERLVPVKSPTPQPPAPMSPKAHENFKRVEKEKTEALEARKAAEAQLETFKTQVAEREKRIQDLEATMQQQRANTGNVDGLQATLQERDQTIRALQQELKAAAITRDPEFVDRYVNGRKFQEETLADLGTAVGMTKDVVHQIIRMGDESKLAEIRDALPPAQQRRWDAALLKREQIALEREQAEQNADKTWEQMQKQRQEGFQAQQAQIAHENRRLAKTVMGGILEKVPELKENRIINEHLSQIAEGISGGKGSEHWPKEKIVESVMMSKVYETACAGMNSRIQELEGKLKTETEERQKVESILKSRGIPYSDSAGFQSTAPAKAATPTRLSDQIVVNRRL
jgi:DNA repair exonuclease SbcCD ATPase subunit